VINACAAILVITLVIHRQARAALTAPMVLAGLQPRTEVLVGARAGAQVTIALTVMQITLAGTASRILVAALSLLCASTSTANAITVKKWATRRWTVLRNLLT